MRRVGLIRAAPVSIAARRERNGEAKTVASACRRDTPKTQNTAEHTLSAPRATSTARGKGGATSTRSTYTRYRERRWNAPRRPPHRPAAPRPLWASGTRNSRRPRKATLRGAALNSARPTVRDTQFDPRPRHQPGCGRRRHGQLYFTRAKPSAPQEWRKDLSLNGRGVGLGQRTEISPRAGAQPFTDSPVQLRR